MGGGQEAMEVTTTSTRIGKFEARFVLKESTIKFFYLNICFDNANVHAHVLLLLQIHVFIMYLSALYLFILC